MVSSRRARSARMSSGRSRSAGSGCSRLSVLPAGSSGGFVVSRLERQVEILPVGHAPELSQLQHDAALRLEQRVVYCVQIVADRLLDPLVELAVVAVGVANHLLADILGDGAFAGQTELFESSQEGV